MPTYDFKCECGETQELFMKLADYKAPECPTGCGKVMKQVIGNYAVIPDFEPYVDENLSSEPILVKSKKHRRELMKELGVSEKYGKGWW